MSSESVCHVARSWVDVGSFHTRLLVRFMIFTASVRNILGTLVYAYSEEVSAWYVLNLTRAVSNVNDEFKICDLA
jgi:hypothetical protein